MSVIVGRFPARYLRPEVVDILSQFLPRQIVSRTDIDITVPHRMYACCTEAVVVHRPSVLVRAGTNPGVDEIIIHPEFFDTKTASGLALIAHEMWHNKQRYDIPDFDAVFAHWAIETERRGLPPWKNPLEVEAYDFEERVRQQLLEQGFPPGRPMGLE